MKAIRDRYDRRRAPVLALRAGADMVMALGTQEEQSAAVQAIGAAQARGELKLPELLKARARLDALAIRFPVDPSDYPATHRETDDQLMRRAWAAGLTTLGAPRAPLRNEPLRVLTQRIVPCDGVSEAGPTGKDVAALFAGFANLEFVELDDLQQLDWTAIPQDGRCNVLVSNHHDRYMRATPWRPDLHLSKLV